MPIKVNPGENEKEFISRCISEEVSNGKDKEQAAAICYTCWEEKDMAEEELANYELTIDDANYDGVTAISIVNSPAIEENFLVFNKTPKMNITFAKPNIDKRIITGPALIPNKDIYRVDKFGQPYNVHFSEETVKKISENFLIQNKNSNVTLEHEVNVNDISLIESWIVGFDPKIDKSYLLGYTDLTPGTWMISMKINNDDIWKNVIRTGEGKGFSIEGYFTTLYDKYSKYENEDDKKLKEIKKLLDLLDE